MSTGRRTKYTDYVKVKAIADRLDISENQVRDFCTEAGVEPRYMFTQKLYSFTEVQEKLFTESRSNAKKRAKKRASR